MKKFFFVLFILGGSFIYGLEWSTPKTLSPTNQVIYFPKVVSENRCVVAIWDNPVGETIQTVNSQNGGVLWSTPSIITSLAVNSTMAMEGEKVITLWSQRIGLNYQVGESHSYDCGKTWSSPQSLSGVSAGSSFIPHVSFSGNHILAMWNDLDGAVYRIQEAHSQDSGVTWSSFQNISPAGLSADKPVVALNGDLAIAAWEISKANSIIQVAYSHNGGANWSSPVDLSTSGQDGYLPQITIQGQNVVVGWWSDLATNIVQISVSHDGGVHWTDPKTVSSSLYDSYIGELAMYENHVIAIMESYNPSLGFIQITTSDDDGNTWSDPITISSLAFDSSNEHIAMNDQIAVATWTESQGNLHHITTSYSFDFGKTWSESYSFPGDDNRQSSTTLSQNRANLIWVNELLKAAQFSYLNLQVPLEVTWAKDKTRALFQNDLVNILSWKSIPGASLYRVYSDADLTHKIYENDSPIFYDHGQKEGRVKTYYVTWVDYVGLESPSTKITVP